MKGTEKQIKWAEDIKNKFYYDTLGPGYKCSDDDRAKKLAIMEEETPKAADLFHRIMAVENAAWWIENRTNLEVFGLAKLRKMEANGRFTVEQ